MDLPILYDVVQQAKYKNMGVTFHPVTNEPYYEGWQSGEYEDYWSGPKMDFMGSKFAPFNHNYLYGWSVIDMIEGAYRAINEHKPSQLKVAELLKDMDKKVGGHDSTGQYVIYVEQFGGHPLALLVQAFKFNLLGKNEIVFLLNLFFTVEANKLKSYNSVSSILLPVCIGTQLYAFGWRKTLAIWAVGAAVTEGLALQIGYPFAGWSLITFMIYGQMVNETFSDSKLRTVRGGLQTLRGLGVNGLGGYGTYVTLSNLYYDPAPFLQKSQKTGAHHGVHHLGLVAGFLMNRWMR